MSADEQECKLHWQPMSIHQQSGLTNCWQKNDFQRAFPENYFQLFVGFSGEHGQAAIRGWSDNHLEMNMATRIAPVLERKGRSYLQIIW
jgi:hypothetical protein